MTVGPDLLKAAEANDPAAIDMMTIWGLGADAEIGGNLAPGLWMHGGSLRVLEANQARRDLQRSRPPATTTRTRWRRPPRSACRHAVILGERDMMTPPSNGKTLAAALPNARTVVLRGAGHTMMIERPDEVLKALRG